MGVEDFCFCLVNGCLTLLALAYPLQGSDILSNPSILPMLAQQGAAPAPEPAVSLSAAGLGQAGANTLGNLSGLTSSAPAPADARTNEQLAAANIPLNYLQLLSGANAFQGGLGGI